MEIYVSPRHEKKHITIVIHSHFNALSTMMKITLFLFAVVGTACAACGPSSKFDDMTGAPCKAGDVGADVQVDKAVS